MENMDKITLQLLSNKNQYNKYLSKEDPAKYREHQEYLQKIKKYKYRILGYVKEFLENPEQDFNIEMNEMFSHLAKISIKYCFMKDLENRDGPYETEDHDILFASETTNEKDSQEEYGQEEYGKEEYGQEEYGKEEYGKEEDDKQDLILKRREPREKSYWGSQITKQKSTMDSFFGNKK